MDEDFSISAMSCKCSQEQASGADRLEFTF